MSIFEQCRLSVVGVLSAAVLAATVGLAPAHADETASGEAVAAQTADAAAEVGQVLDLDRFVEAGEGFESADTTVAVKDTTVSMDVGAETELALTLPVTPDTEAVVAEDGTLVFAGQSEGLHAEVQSIEDGTARVLTVAQENYSHSPLHEYGYGVQLPEGASLAQLADGTVAVVETAADVPPAAPVDLTAVLPDPADVDPADFEENTAPAEAMGPADDGLPEGTVVLTAFQQPWAVDAEGRELPTSLQVDNGRLVQVVDTTDAVFPVVSDPLPLIAIVLGAAARALAPHAIRAFAATTIRAGVGYTTRGGYATFARFKSAAGTRSGYQWHHIVEQSTISKKGWSPLAIHHRNNLVQIPTGVHQRCINSWMARKGVRSFGVSASSSQTMRTWVHQQTFSTQHSIGVALLRHCGVQI